MPALRLRRLRKNRAIRNWVSQTRLRPEDIILPYFAAEGKGVKEPIKSMPGVHRLSINNLIKDAGEARRTGINAILLFGIPKFKDELGSQAYQKKAIIQKAVKALKKEDKDLIVITDVCLCGYTSHGHCGLVRKIKNVKSGIIDNEATLKILSEVALSHAEAGADFVAPSAMMDGQVRAIRESLDKNGFGDVGILAYSAKYASNFYGPFREALDSAPRFGDRKSYQMDFRNSDEALRETEEDIAEGADIVMIKPALAYLDIIYRVKEKFNIPLAAYSVSGEYSMIKRAGAGDGIREKDLALEVLTSIKRAGADMIISYFGKEIGKWLS